MDKSKTSFSILKEIRSNPRQLIEWTNIWNYPYLKISFWFEKKWGRLYLANLTTWEPICILDTGGVLYLTTITTKGTGGKDQKFSMHQFQLWLNYFKVKIKMKLSFDTQRFWGFRNKFFWEISCNFSRAKNMQSKFEYFHECTMSPDAINWQCKLTKRSPQTFCGSPQPKNPAWITAYDFQWMI